MAVTDDRSLSVKAVAASFMSVACVTVILRCYVRLRIVRSFGWDDTMMVLAMAFYLMFSGCMIGGSLYGTGKRFAVLSRHERVVAMKYWWLCEIAYCFASVGCKVSVCIFLMRITVKRIHHWILYTVMFLTVASGLAFMFLMLLQCDPLEYFWTRVAFDPSIEGSCIPIQTVIDMTYVYSAFAALCDFTVGILPIFLVRKLNMHRRTKWAVAGILGMACIASCAVIVRFPYVDTFRNPDFLYATVDIAIWSNIETGLGISAGSMATLRPLLRVLRGSSAPESYSLGAGGSSRKPGPSRDRRFPLGSLDGEAHGRLRPDDQAVTVTTVHAKHENDAWLGQNDTWLGRNDTWLAGSQSSSEERLNGEIQREDHGDGEMGLSVQRSFQVVRTPADAWR